MPHWAHGHLVKGPDDDTASQRPTAPVVSAVERPPDCVNKHQTPPFSNVCNMMDRLRNGEASKRREILTKSMEAWRETVGNDLYPLIRLLLPDVSRDEPDCADQISEIARDQYIISKKPFSQPAMLRF